VDYIYNRDLNDPGLPQRETCRVLKGAYTGVDNARGGLRRQLAAASRRGSRLVPTCAANGQAGACFQRLNNAVGNQVRPLT